MRIHFLGGVETVTGSQHLVEAGGHRVLRDCGLFQGRREEAFKTNRQPPFAPAQVDATVFSHAHIDHCGNLPTLARLGYQNPVFATTATCALGEVMLRDAAHIQEQDAAYLNQKTNRQGLPPVEPLYTLRDAEAALRLFQGAHYHAPVEVAPGINVLFQDAGHILGSALTTFDITENRQTCRIAFAFDLGRKHLPLIRDPESVGAVDVLVLESTYGDRLHAHAEDARTQLRDEVRQTIARGGKVLIPSFALERAQEIIYHLSSLVDAGELPKLPVFVDSPMAKAVTKVFESQPGYLDEEYQALRQRQGSVLAPRWVTFLETVAESKAVTASKQPAIVIAASGMCEHGRILHHLKHGISNPLNTILFVGYQAQATLGRKLIEGEKRARIFGDWLEVRARCKALNAFSAHADRNELLEYVNQLRAKKIFLVHGEPKQRQALAEALAQTTASQVFTPRQGEVVECP